MASLEAIVRVNWEAAQGQVGWEVSRNEGSNYVRIVNSNGVLIARMPMAAIKALHLGLGQLLAVARNSDREHHPSVDPPSLPGSSAYIETVRQAHAHA